MADMKVIVNTYPNTEAIFEIKFEKTFEGKISVKDLGMAADETPDEYNKKLEAELLEDQTLYKGSNPWGPRRGYTPYVLHDGKECWRGEEFRFDAGCSRQSSAQSKELYNYVWNEFFMKEINFGM